MIVKKEIESDLRRLNKLYASSMSDPNLNDPIFFSKLAVLELTGWVEESLDIVAERAAKGRVKSAKFNNLVCEAIKKNSGFSYDNHFLFMMSKIIGVSECEALHDYLDSDGKLSVLKGELDAVSEQRRKAAHVNLARTTIAFDAPSVSLGRLYRIYPIFRDMYSWFCYN